MRTGVSVAGYAETATFAVVTGSAASDYPIANLATLHLPTKVARITPSGGAVAFTAVLTADKTVQFAALAAHTLPAGATVRVRFYSDAAMTTLVSDQGPTAIPTPVESYAQTFPVVLTAGLTVRAVRFDVASAGSDPVDVGAVEIGGWWEWPYVTAGAEVGVAETGDDLEFLGGGSDGADDFTPRIYEGEIAALALATSTTTAIDFQKLKGLTRPFVFVEDYDDADTWVRGCFLAVNADLPAMVAQLYDADAFQFRLVEHVR